MFCPKRTGGNYWLVVYWRCVRWSAMRRLSCWWSQPWSSTPFTTTSLGGRSSSILGCQPPSSTTITTMPTTTLGTLTSQLWAQHFWMIDVEHHLCFSVQQIDANGKCWSPSAVEYFQPGVLFTKRHSLQHAVPFKSLYIYFLISLQADDNLPAPAAPSLLSEVVAKTSWQPCFVCPLRTQRHGVGELQTCFRYNKSTESPTVCGAFSAHWLIKCKIFLLLLYVQDLANAVALLTWLQHWFIFRPVCPGLPDSPWQPSV